MKMPPLLEDVKVKMEERREKLKARIDEWKERGWRGQRSGSRLQIVKEIREKGLVSAIKARREARLQRSRGQLGREPDEIEPAFPADMRVRKEKEVVGTVGKREIAIEI